MVRDAAGEFGERVAGEHLESGNHEQQSHEPAQGDVIALHSSCSCCSTTEVWIGAPTSGGAVTFNGWSLWRGQRSRLRLEPDLRLYGIAPAQKARYARRTW